MLAGVEEQLFYAWFRDTGLRTFESVGDGNFNG